MNRYWKINSDPIVESQNRPSLTHHEVTNYIDPFRRVDGKWDWRLVVRGENRCGPNSGGFASKALALKDASECLSFMVYNVLD